MVTLVGRRPEAKENHSAHISYHGFTLGNVRINLSSLYSGETTGDPSTRVRDRVLSIQCWWLSASNEMPCLLKGAGLCQTWEGGEKMWVEWQDQAGGAQQARDWSDKWHRHLVAFLCSVHLTNLLVCIPAWKIRELWGKCSTALGGIIQQEGHDFHSLFLTMGKKLREKVIAVCNNKLKQVEVNKKYESYFVIHSCFHFILYSQASKMCNHTYKFKHM